MTASPGASPYSFSSPPTIGARVRVAKDAMFSRERVGAFEGVSCGTHARVKCDDGSVAIAPMHALSPAGEK